MYILSQQIWSEEKEKLHAEIVQWREAKHREESEKKAIEAERSNLQTVRNLSPTILQFLAN